MRLDEQDLKSRGRKRSSENPSRKPCLNFFPYETMVSHQFPLPLFSLIHTSVSATVATAQAQRRLREKFDLHGVEPLLSFQGNIITNCSI